MSVLFLSFFPRMQSMERQRDDLLRERDALREQILSEHQKWFDAKEERIVAAALGEKTETDESRQRGGSSPSGYLPPIFISSATTKVDRRTVEIVFRISNQGDALRNRGGFLFAVFENQDPEQTRFAVSPNVKLNGEGFPAIYKAGVRFPRVRKPVTYRRKVRRKGEEDYFTHVTLYLFSLRGGLLVKESFELDRDLFSKGKPAQRIQNLLKT